MSELVLPQAPRLAVGAQPPGTPYACGMQVISWEQGDLSLNPYPKGVADPLAHMVQGTNDDVCGSLTRKHGGVDLLCPRCSMDVLALAHRTVGTAGASRAQMWRWAAELLIGEDVGLVHTAAHPRVIEVISEAAGAAQAMAAGSDGYFVRMPRYEISGLATPDHYRASYALRIARRALDCATHTNQAREGLFHCLGELYVDVHMAGPIYEDRRGDRLAAAHRVIDAWERVTDRRAPEPDMARLAEVAAEMEMAAA